MTWSGEKPIAPSQLQIYLRSLLILLIAGATLACVARPEEAENPAMSVTLPSSVGVWNLAGPAKRVEPGAIFDYMDGAGEMYLGYRFKALDVYQYKSAAQDEILVELYWMETSDDAWGLLSGDWGGEPVELKPAHDNGSHREIRALYGAGLFRVWSGNLYARVLAYQETDVSKPAVLEIGKAIVAGRAESRSPLLAKVLPSTVGNRFSLRSDRIVFLRSHLVLNSVYFLSQENLLDLGLECELAAATYRREDGASAAKPVRVLLVRYANQEAAEKALRHFQRVYLSGKPILPGNSGAAAIEDGWVGFVLSGRGLGLVFEAPDEVSAHLFLENSKRALENVEVSNDRR